MPARVDPPPGTSGAGPLRPRTLQRRALLLTLLGSLLPFSILGVGAWIVFGEIIADRAREQLRTVVRDHAATLDLFLSEWLSALHVVAACHDREEITAPGRLDRVLGDLGAAFSQSFLDLGVFSESGDHVAYAGPHDLLGRNYREADWFVRAVADGRTVSDVFLGYRNLPHFVMAIRRDEGGGRFFVLRATINSEVFDRIVRQGRLGATGDCFVVDREGRFQTRPADGAAPLSPSGVEIPAHGGSLAPVDAVGGRLLRATEPIMEGRWHFVAQQDEGEAMAPVRRAMIRGVFVFAAGAGIIALTAFFSTRILIRLVTRAVERAEELDLRLLRAGQLASIGEMATGLAHEINNPLAIILSEQTNVSDLLGEMPREERVAEAEQSIARTKRQVERCKAITMKMLQFGRGSGGQGRPVDVAGQLEEIVGLLSQQARVDDVELSLTAPRGLPRIVIDPGELQQVVTNLVNNAVQAMPAGGRCMISTWMEDGDVHIAVDDTGPGIPPELREKVFEPFYTTKPVGKGTGLGLSVCYGIVTKWGGRIRVETAGSSGARFHLRFPSAEEGRTHERKET